MNEPSSNIDRILVECEKTPEKIPYLAWHFFQNELQPHQLTIFEGNNNLFDSSPPICVGAIFRSFLFQFSFFVFVFVAYVLHYPMFPAATNSILSEFCVCLCVFNSSNSKWELGEKTSAPHPGI